MADGKTKRRSRFPRETKIAVWHRTAMGESDPTITAAFAETDRPMSLSTVRRWRAEFTELTDSAVARLPGDLQLYWSELTGRSIPLIPISVPDFPVPDETVRELVVFAGLLVERLVPPPPDEAARVTDESALWLGSDVGSPFGVQATDDASRAVEADWPALRCDIRKHPLFTELGEHLDRDHPVFSALDQVQECYSTYREASAQAWQHIRSELLVKAGLFTQEESRRLADVLLKDAFHWASTGGGFEFNLEAEPKAANVGGQDQSRVWAVRLGTAELQRATPEEIDTVRSRWPGLVQDARGARVIERLAETWAAAERSIQVFRVMMPARPFLRQILMGSGPP